MIRTEKSIVTDAPLEKVFAYVADPAHGPEYMPVFAEVKDLQRLPDGRYTYTLVGKFLGMHFDFKNEQVEVIPNERIVEKGHGAGIDSTTSMRFERLADGKTRVTMVDETTILGGGPLAKFGEPFLEKYFDRSTELAMEAAKAHIEAGALAGTPS